MVDSREKLIRNEHAKGLTDAAWVDWALNKDHWPVYENIKAVLDSPQAFNDARDLVERMELDGWAYYGTDGDGEVFLCFSKLFPVTDGEREQARAWLEKYSD